MAYLLLAFIFQGGMANPPEQPGKVNVYLALAYGLLWAIFVVYAWVIHRREQRLEREVEELKKTLGEQ